MEETGEAGVVREEGSSGGKAAPWNPVQGEGEWYPPVARLQPTPGLFLRELPETLYSCQPFGMTLIS